MVAEALGADQDVKLGAKQLLGQRARQPGMLDHFQGGRVKIRLRNNLQEQLEDQPVQLLPLAGEIQLIRRVTKQRVAKQVRGLRGQVGHGGIV